MTKSEELALLGTLAENELRARVGEDLARALLDKSGGRGANWGLQAFEWVVESVRSLADRCRGDDPRDVLMIFVVGCSALPADYDVSGATMDNVAELLGIPKPSDYIERTGLDYNPPRIQNFAFLSTALIVLKKANRHQFLS